MNLKCVVCLKLADIMEDGHYLCEDCFKKTVYWLGWPSENNNGGKQISQLRKERNEEKN